MNLTNILFDDDPEFIAAIEKNEENRFKEAEKYWTGIKIFKQKSDAEIFINDNFKNENLEVVMLGHYIIDLMRVFAIHKNQDLLLQVDGTFKEFKGE